MQEKLESYSAPDLSDYDKRIDLAKQKLDMLETEINLVLDEVTLVADVAKELKNDLKSDVRRIETIVETNRDINYCSSQFQIIRCKTLRKILGSLRCASSHLAFCAQPNETIGQKTRFQTQCFAHHAIRFFLCFNFKIRIFNSNKSNTKK